jgi:hypothetical protein
MTKTIQMYFRQNWFSSQVIKILILAVESKMIQLKRSKICLKKALFPDFIGI